MLDSEDMKILAIETSCDETAVSVVEAKGDTEHLQFEVLSHLISSQIALHTKWGGVVPSLAKREHARNLLPLLLESLYESGLVNPKQKKIRDNLTIQEAAEVRRILEREPELLDLFLQHIPAIKPPEVDIIVVTQGPGLEPALWVGINLAKALSFVWKIPVIPVNHMEGHILSVMATLDKKQPKINNIKFPVLSLLISGGHTELVLSKDWLNYQVIGQTRDDAVGEAFDKVARILGLPYPGGPEISRLADLASGHPPEKLPRPMLNSNDFDFSFSGLKTAVLYLVKKLSPLSQINRVEIAREFQQAVIDVLITKTGRAIQKYHPHTLVIGGGVVANKDLREKFGEVIKEHFPTVRLLVPDLSLSTDNATMIALAGYLRVQAAEGQVPTNDFAAHGTLPLS
jgi:N6-L-threonylcarbamoyladenine synthase